MTNKCEKCGQSKSASRLVEEQKKTILKLKLVLRQALYAEHEGVRDDVLNDNKAFFEAE
jgi:hypothetical protein